MKYADFEHAVSLSDISKLRCFPLNANREAAVLCNASNTNHTDSFTQQCDICLKVKAKITSSTFKQLDASRMNFYGTKTVGIVFHFKCWIILYTPSFSVFCSIL